MAKTDNLMVMLGTVILIVSLVGSAVGGQPDNRPPPPPPGQGGFELKTAQQTITGSGSENSEKEHGMSVCVTNLVTFSVSLTWQDEGAARPGQTNQPDELGISVASPAGEAKSQKATTGSAKVDYSFPVTEKSAASKTSRAGMGPWSVNVEIGTCGDNTPLIPDPLGLRTTPDTGNAYTLEITYTYYEKAKGA